MSSFETTIWARLESLKGGHDASAREFVDRYRPPLLRFIAAQGYSSQDSEDLSQEVFLRLFSRNLLAKADRTRGRFRSYLLAITRNVLREDRERRLAKKRSRHGVVPLDEALETATSDKGFDELWGVHLLARALDGLKAKHPRQHEVVRLQFYEGLSLRKIADRLGVTVQLVKNDVLRARRRLARAIRAEVARYASSREEYDEELGAFVRLLDGR
jgi:RNA polymerase sigma-70 factor (ECF subfamily)